MVSDEQIRNPKRKRIRSAGGRDTQMRISVTAAILYRRCEARIIDQYRHFLMQILQPHFVERCSINRREANEIPRLEPRWRTR